MRKTTAVILITLASLFIVSCSLFSKAPVKHYYQIYYSPKEGTARTIPATVRIKSFEEDKIYRRHNLVYRKSFEEMFYYNTHFWASRPADMLTDIVANHIAKKNMFSEVIVAMDKRPKYVITGRLTALDEIISGEKRYARVGITFELRDYDTNTVIVAHSFEERKEVAGMEPVYVVRAMGEIIDSQIEQFIEKIYASIPEEED